MESDYSIAVRLLLHLGLVIVSALCVNTLFSRVVVETTPSKDNVMIVTNWNNVILLILTAIFAVVEICFICTYFTEDVNYNYEIFAIIMQLYYMIQLHTLLSKRKETT